MHDIVIPKLNANDESYVLVEWVCADGDRVEPGQPLAVVETSKATLDLEAERAGVLQQVARERTTCAVGEVVGRLYATEAERLVATEGVTPATEGAAAGGDGSGVAAVDGTAVAGLLVTEPARRLAAEHGIDEVSLAALGPGVVRTADVERLIAVGAPPTGNRRTLMRVQRAVAAAVSASHRDVPAAFVAIRVCADAFLGLRDAEGAATPVGLPELVVRVIAERFANFPDFFATLDGDDVITAERPNVGVTVDAGTGLYVPVIADAANMPVARIGERLAAFHRAALTTGFVETELLGGTITLAPHTYRDVVTAVPIVFPGQTVTVSLTGLRGEPALDRSGGTVRRTVYELGVAYDHRVVNGRDAVLFLKAAKADLETPSRLAALLGP